MTWGCQMNEYDSSRLYDLMEDQQMVRAQSAEEADVILLNTCSIREKPQEKVFSELGRLEKIRKHNPNLRIGVGGCVGAQEGDQLLKRAKNVDFVFGPQTIHKVPELLNSAQSDELRLADVTFQEIEKFDHLPKPQLSGASAYLSIMEGCDKFCTFCIVPYTRGREVSRPPADILQEAIDYVEQGATEIVVLGQNVNAWSNLDLNFGWLLERLGEIPQLQRIRYTTPHPVDMTPDVIAAHAKVDKLAAHVHLPVQSGSNRILDKMKRLYTREQFIETVAQLREARSGMVISSDFIVGFPGETEEDFQQTIDLAKTIEFDTSYSFVFSARPGTPAEFLEDPVDLDIAKDRLARLQSVLEESAQRIRNNLIGKRVPCLVNGYAKRHASQMVARTDGYQIVHIDDVQPHLINQLVDVDITASTQHGLIGSFA